MSHTVLLIRPFYDKHGKLWDAKVYEDFPWSKEEAPSSTKFLETKEEIAEAEELVASGRKLPPGAKPDPRETAKTLKDIGNVKD